MGKLKDLTGQKFGKLTVIERAEKKGKYSFWVCQCECGNKKIIRQDNLTTGHTTSCGCNAKKHLMGDTRIYHIWHTMLRRCNDKKHEKYEFYGNKGIEVCKEWADFKNFYNWAIVNGYNDKLTLDRVDFNGNYEPDNCRWITQKEQCRNKKNNLYIEYQGQTKTLVEWTELLNISYSRTYSQIKRGWSIDKVLESEVRE